MVRNTLTILSVVKIAVIDMLPAVKLSRLVEKTTLLDLFVEKIDCSLIEINFIYLLKLYLWLVRISHTGTLPGIDYPHLYLGIYH